MAGFPSNDLTTTSQSAFSNNFSVLKSRSIPNVKRPFASSKDGSDTSNHNTLDSPSSSGSFGISQVASPFSKTGNVNVDASSNSELSVLAIPTTSSSKFKNFSPQEEVGDVVENVPGGSKIPDDARKKRFENLPKQNRFFEMKKQRDELRLKYIREGILPDPERAQDLSAAKNLLGTCLEMCPEFEREEREFQNEGDILEMFSGTNRIDPAIAVKIYRRPAAGRELPLPEDVRPPVVLRQTLDYLFHKLLPSDPSSPQFTVVQPFMWNRTRAIRQDFIVQGLRGDLEIECHERIARYHILCLHWKGGLGAEGWSEQQELEQLRKTIRSLTEFYEDYRRSTGNNASNEAEFRAYNLLLHMQDPETLREVEGLPLEIFDSINIQAALRLRGYAQRSNNVVRRGRPLNTEATMNLWTKFFGEIRMSKDVTYLLACLAENAFSQVRAGAIKAMSKTYLERHAPLSLDYLRKILGMDSDEEVRQFATLLNCEEVKSQTDDNAIIGMRLAKANEDKPLPTVPFSQSVVEVKRDGATVQDIVDGKVSNAAPLVTISPPLFQVSIPSSALAEQASKVHTSVIAPQAFSQLTAPIPKITPLALSSAASTSPAFSSSTSNTTSIRKTSPINPIFDSRLSPAAPIFKPNLYSSPSSVKAEPVTDVSDIYKVKSAKSDTFNFGVQTDPSIDATASINSSVPTPLTYPSPDASKSLEYIHLAVASERKEEEKDAFSNKSPFHATAASSQPISVTVPTEVIAQKPKRTISSVANCLADYLIQTFIDQKLVNISHQACLKEMRYRKAEARKEMIDEKIEQLYLAAKEEVLGDCIAEVASETIADEFRIRSLERLVLRGRAKALKKITEKKRQAERLGKIRHELDQRGLKSNPLNDNIHFKSNGSRYSGRIKSSDDQELKNVLRLAKEHRNKLWMDGSFTEAIKSHLSVVATSSGLKEWSAALSVCQAGSISSSWLETKFSLRERSSIRLGDGLEITNLESTSSNHLEKSQSIGLILFEMDPSFGKSGNNDWQRDTKRLEKLSQQQYILHSQWLPKLMLISWSKEQCQDKKFILKQLKLGATDTQRFKWSQVEICCLDESNRSPQDSFETCLATLLRNIPTNQRSHHLDIDGTAEICKVNWIKLLNNLQDANGFMMNEEAMSSLALDAFKAVTILGSRTLFTVIAISDTLLEEDEEVDYCEIPFSEDGAKKASHRTTQEILYNLALSQLSKCEEQMNVRLFSLLRFWLMEELQGKKVFPWVSYFEQLFQCHLNRLHDVWLDCKYPLSKASTSHVESLESLCHQVCLEIDWKMRDSVVISSSSPNKTDSPKKRRVVQEEDQIETMGKARKREKSIQSSIQSSSVNNLRALMASATSLIDDSTSL